ncbi:fibrillin-2-like [Corticium candelabrum]|uniref:fibrillin-2-like n=1 Tax=Corticium candelabrum TaxID=121492 RepID=UPI002E2581B6|nr:fibrillin-2-like [Corticium candelabrum]
MVHLASSNVLITADGDYQVVVSVPPSFKGHVCGLCGNFNGNISDDLALANGTVLSASNINGSDSALSVSGYHVFGRSWAVPAVQRLILNPEDDCLDELIVPWCDRRPENKKKVEEFCDVIRDTSGPFVRCHGAIDPENPYGHCVLDICARNGSLRYGCAAIKSYEGVCQRRLRRQFVPSVADCANDPCGDLTPCFPNVVCTNNDTSFPPYHCGDCPSGYVGNGLVCNDINECALATPCAPEVTCINNVGNFVCPVCPIGYVGGNKTGRGLDDANTDRQVCTDVDECQINNGGCDTLTSCTNTIGSFQCGPCPLGYLGTGLTGCRRRPCSILATPVDGSKVCNGHVFEDVVWFSCNSGFELFGSDVRQCQADGTWNGSLTNCSDIDECVMGTDNCDLNAECNNTHGSFICTCNVCYSGSGTICTRKRCSVLAPPQQGIVSSSDNLCGQNVTFSCNAGYRLLGSNSRVCGEDSQWSATQPICEDIDECAEQSHNCAQVGGKCNNTAGSFTCSCIDCYAGDGTTCTLIDCGGLATPSQGTKSSSQTTCRTTVAFSCNSGFRLNGSSSRTCQNNGRWSGNSSSCIDINECTEGSHNCAPIGGMCANTVGSFTCTCINCYAGDGTACTLVDCGGLATPSNGVKNSIHTTCGTTVAFSCNTGFDLRGSNSRNCQHNGLWSGNQPTCRDIDECSIGSHKCHTNANCTNTIGNYSCSCHNCYTGNGFSCNLINCSRLSAPAEGSASGSQTSCGSTVTFSCSSGYTLSGSTSRTCQTNGAWNGSTALCHRRPCNILTTLVDGSKVGNGHVFEDVVRFSCNSGFELFGSDVRQCQADGTWNGSLTNCSGKRCSVLTPPQQGHVSSSDNLCGQNVTFLCNVGYRLLGSNIRACGEDSRWSATQPICEDIDECAEQSHNCAQVGGNCSNTPGSFTCSCIDCYAGDGTTCTFIDCGDLATPSQGTKSSSQTACRTTVALSCNNGFRLNGSSSRTCQNNGRWSGNSSSCLDINECTEGSHNCAPIGGMCTNTVGSFTCTCINCYAGDGTACTLVDCGGLATPSNGVKNSIQTTCGTTVAFSCKTGFDLRGSNSRTCQHNGLWSGTQPTCRDIDECSNGSHRCHTNAICTNTIGSYSCSCHNCYTGNGFSCNLINCGRLSAPAEGSVSGSQTSCGSTVTFSCSSGYTLSGSTSRTCQTNGAWNGSTALCHRRPCSILTTPVDGSKILIEKRCGVLAPPQEGTVSSRDNLCGQSVTFSCNVGYRLLGSNSRVCGEDSQWSATQPICKDIDECAEQSHNCAQVGGKCSNTAGSFTCSCIDCYAGDGRTCTLIDCGGLATPSQGTKSSSQTTCRTTVAFSCNSGFRSNGSSSRTCQNNGRWSGNSSSCIGQLFLYDLIGTVNAVFFVGLSRYQ